MAGPGESRGISRRPKILDLLGAGSQPEESASAREDAQVLVQTVREHTSRFTEGPAPEPDEVRERREARIRRESHQET